VIDDLLLWNGRAADPAPSKREAFVSADQAAAKAVSIRETLDERQPPASDSKSAPGFELSASSPTGGRVF